MTPLSIFLTIFAFVATIILILWRPKGLNETIPALFGAIIVLISGSVNLLDLLDISQKITGAAVTIMATMIMAFALESFGFFKWVAQKMLEFSKGSSKRLFWLTCTLCFLMTLFLNNDGSILITTPILILLLKHLGLKKHELLPYLISGALVATASSVPIGVSNIVNLISLEIIGMDLYLHTVMMFVPGTLGLLFLTVLLYLIFYKKLPRTLPNYQSLIIHGLEKKHPLQDSDQTMKSSIKLMICALVFVFLVRISLFVASYLGISVALIAVLGSSILLIWRAFYLKVYPTDILKKTPWHIFIFAFSMYVLIYGLQNIGLTDLLVTILEPVVSEGLFYASFTMGALLTIFSNIFNNHPALMIGTITLNEMALDHITLKTIYLANIIGSDIGSLILPTGTLATLIWMHILRENKIKVSWASYISVTLKVIPATLVFTLLCLYYWVALFFVD
ncbi:arsenic transporter [Sutcliffiella rhizosphaerae]|uniref:Arsenical pump membrane protein n=1 Tax=Sutcliffiella rhizosphaerae TaxID=2880967 RepID=A0ABM8YUQ1_9BACI|nr:arsenic transporter [Sutcliffiella rhizosphaerae]CAG9623709.1 Arsenical pump membrane protein [Sutcliffiella rhizosphaerae]